ncbi:MAG: hypothetical protein ACREQI_08600 [Candidatus Binataceae bacterium]
MKKFSMTIAVALLGAAFAVAANVQPAFAAHKKGDCDIVMKDLSSGKKPKEVAKDLKVSTRHVYYCRGKARKAAKAAAAAKPAEAKAPVAAKAAAKSPAPAAKTN